MTRMSTRRSFLLRSGALGCSLAASPILTPVGLASAPGDNRLVVIILRGGVDGLDVVRPIGDPAFQSARPGLLNSSEVGIDLTGFFALHPALLPLMPLWTAGELGFVHVASTPYRDKRSHFDGQDLLEAGTVDLSGGGREGWLNRLVQVLPGANARTAFSVGDGEMLIAAGAAEVSNWSPSVDVVLSAAGLGLLRQVMAEDPVFARAMSEAVELAALDGDQVVFPDTHDGRMEAMVEDMQPIPRGDGHLRIAEFAASQLRHETRIATFSLGGWDTHRNQKNALKGPLGRLADTILALKQGCGADVWGKTTVLAMTEFGRTVRENGTGGTDHGTGGMMLVAGGAVRGGRVHGLWPGLDEASLYDRRDLMPTSDLRGWAAWAMRASFGVVRSELERSVFPGLDLGDDPGLML
ncbi:DUF1501 domain-containing protein [Shimia biformata]|uniref:DUF1501 domain-containing protein n=1 Tax=Shimia biformata TaxID=1294299 RepID=UPI00194E1183|nr:DUF1501 domain-containing protein [Shimia biformata]